VPALICDSYALRSLRAAAIWGDYFALREQNKPPTDLKDKSAIAINFHHPPKISPPPCIISAFAYVGNPIFQSHGFWFLVFGLWFVIPPHS